MPKITVLAPFNFAIGPTVKHYAKGEQDVPQVVATHASANGFIAKPKAPAEPVEAKQ